MTEPVWIDKEALLLLHARGLSRFGGRGGFLDEGLLDSALARPVNAYRYNSITDLTTLAASYAFGINKNHAFVDGNKRAAFVAVGVFLDANGWTLTASPADAISAMLALASGELSEAGFAAWLKLNIAKKP